MVRVNELAEPVNFFAPAVLGGRSWAVGASHALIVNCVHAASWVHPPNVPPHPDVGRLSVIENGLHVKLAIVKQHADV